MATNRVTVGMHPFSSATWAAKLLSKNRKPSSAWFATQTIWSSESRGLMVCSTAPMPVTAK
jgi:hypothetical protein